MIDQCKYLNSPASSYWTNLTKFGNISKLASLRESRSNLYLCLDVLQIPQRLWLDRILKGSASVSVLSQVILVELFGHCSQGVHGKVFDLACIHLSKVVSMAKTGSDWFLSILATIKEISLSLARVHEKNKKTRHKHIHTLSHIQQTACSPHRRTVSFAESGTECQLLYQGTSYSHNLQTLASCELEWVAMGYPCSIFRYPVVGTDRPSLPQRTSRSCPRLCS